MERQPPTPYPIIQEVVKVLGVKAAEKRISCEFRLTGEVPETIVGDPSRIRQIVTNLVGNAIKFHRKRRCHGQRTRWPHTGR